MNSPAHPWIVVSDFDGTLAEKDVGNELCKEVIPELFADLQGRYRREEITLRELQQGLWTRFPMPEKLFRERAAFYGVFRPGVIEFLTQCQAQNIPVYVASCGIRTYIETILDVHLPHKLRSVIQGVYCNDASFDAKGISDFRPPDSDPSSPYPLDKGALAIKLKAKHPGSRVYGLGNGSSDRSFWPHIDKLAATEGLARWCTEKKIPYTPFENFYDLLSLEIFK